MGQGTPEPGSQDGTVPTKTIRVASSDAVPRNSSSGDPAAQYVVAPSAAVDSVPPSAPSSNDHLPGDTASSQIAGPTPDSSPNPSPSNPSNDDGKATSTNQGVESASRTGTKEDGTVPTYSVGQQNIGGQAGDETQEEATPSLEQVDAPKNTKGKNAHGGKEKAQTWSQRETKETRASKKQNDQDEQGSGGPAKRLRVRSGRR